MVLLKTSHTSNIKGDLYGYSWRKAKSNKITRIKINRWCKNHA